MKPKSFLKAALVASTTIAALTGGQAHATVLTEPSNGDWGLSNAPTPDSTVGITSFSGVFNNDGIDFLALSGLTPSTIYTLSTISVTALGLNTPPALNDVVLCSSQAPGPAVSPNNIFSAWINSNCSTNTRQFTTPSSGLYYVGFVDFTENSYSYTVSLTSDNTGSGGNPVPLPGSAALLGVGLVAAAGLRRRKHTA